MVFTVLRTVHFTTMVPGGTPLGQVVGGSHLLSSPPPVSWKAVGRLLEAGLFATRAQHRLVGPKAVESLKISRY